MVRLPVFVPKSSLRWGGGYDGSGTSFNLTRVMVFPGACVLLRASICRGLACRGLLPSLWALAPLALRAFSRGNRAAGWSCIRSAAFPVMLARSAGAVGPSHSTRRRPHSQRRTTPPAA